MEHARTGDIVGRLGGEEFGWLLLGATVTDALAAVERLLTTLSINPRKESPIGTFSGGVAGLTGHEPEPVSSWDLPKAADRALYQVKVMGKGRILHASLPSP